MLKLKEEKQKLEDIDINIKLNQLKVQLDDLIIEKDQIDQEIKKVNNDLQTATNFVCSHKYMSEDIKHPRESTSDFGDLSKEFESLALKWIQIEEENGGLKMNCKQMKSAMPEMESCRADFNTVKLAGRIAILRAYFNFPTDYVYFYFFNYYISMPQKNWKNCVATKRNF